MRSFLHAAYVSVAALLLVTTASQLAQAQQTPSEQLPPLEYGIIDQVRKVQTDGKISFRHREFQVGRAFRGNPVAVRPTTEDGIYDVHFASHKITTIDLNKLP